MHYYRSNYVDTILLVYNLCSKGRKNIDTGKCRYINIT